MEWKNGVKAVCETSLEMTGNFPFSIELRATGDKGTLAYALSAGVNINDGEHGSNMNWYPAGDEAVYPLKWSRPTCSPGRFANSSTPSATAAPPR